MNMMKHDTVIISFYKQIVTKYEIIWYIIELWK